MQKISSAVIASILILSLLARLPLATYAASPTLNHSRYCSSSNVHTCANAATLLISSTGDVVVVLIAFQNLGILDASPITSITDTQGLTYTAIAPCYQVYIAAQTRYGGVCIYTATTTSTTAETITVTFAQTTHYYAGIGFQDVGNLNNAGADPTTIRTGACTSAGVGNCGTIAQTSSDVAFTASSGQMAFSADYLNFADSPTTTAGSNLAKLEGTTGGAYSALYDTSQAASPTSWPMSISTAYNDWVTTGVILGSVAGGSVTVISPCSFFELQCWWYPFLFMGAYSGSLLMVAQILKVSAKGKAHIFLSAVTMGSLVAVILGVMNIVFPLMMLVVNTVIALRLRG